MRTAALIHRLGIGGVTWLGKCLVSMQEAPSSIPSILQTFMVAHACNPNPSGVEAGEPEVQGHSWLHGPVWDTRDPTSK